MKNTRVDVSTGVGGGLAQSLHQPSLDSLKKSGVEECFLNEVIDNHPDRVDIEPKLARMLLSLCVFFLSRKRFEKFAYSMRINIRIFVHSGIPFVTCFEIYL